MSKEHIVNEIRRTASMNGGTPLGSRGLLKEAGIRPFDWKQYWPRLSEAHAELGYAQNTLRAPIPENQLLHHIAEITLELDRLPTDNDLEYRCRNTETLPNWRTFRKRLGKKEDMVRRLHEFSADRPELRRVHELCGEYTPRRKTHEDTSDSDQPAEGFVYMVRHGSRREYRIGCTTDPLRREGQIRTQLPERIKPVHVIRTDDPYGIESYWHRRFADRRKNGDWFELTREDVAAFKRRKFM